MDTAAVQLIVAFVLGVLVGVLLVIVVRWLFEGMRALRARRRSRRARPSQREPLPQLWATGLPRQRRKVPGAGGVDDFLDGERARPFNPSPGPRDW